MNLTRRLKQFVNEVADAAVSGDGIDVTREECVAEYTDQIVNDDFFSVVCYAHSLGIKIPVALRGALI